MMFSTTGFDLASFSYARTPLGDMRLCRPAGSPTTTVIDVTGTLARRSPPGTHVMLFLGAKYGKESDHNYLLFFMCIPSPFERFSLPRQRLRPNLRD